MAAVVAAQDDARSRRGAWCVQVRLRKGCFGASREHGGDRVAKLARRSEVGQDGIHVCGHRLQILHLCTDILLNSQNLAINRRPMLHFDVDQLQDTPHGGRVMVALVLVSGDARRQLLFVVVVDGLL